MVIGDKMLSIEKEIAHTIIIQKSKFICKLIPVQNKDEIKKHLENVKEEYIGATHYCYAYICGNEKNVQMMENLIVQLVCLY